MAATDLSAMSPNVDHCTTTVVPEGLSSFLQPIVHTTIKSAVLVDSVLDSLLSSYGQSVNASTIPPSKFSAQVHPLLEKIGHEIDQYFLSHWNFRTDKDRSIFLKTDFPKVTCLFFPEAKYDRIESACRMVSILSLIDDVLEHMSLEEGEAYNKKIMDVMDGTASADRSYPEQYIMSGICADMRKIDAELAEQTISAAYIFLRAQTHKTRLSITNLKQYFIYREEDVGQKFLVSLMEFTMDLNVSTMERALLAPLEQYCGKHISIVNDILSWEKEVKAAATGHSEGSTICSAVQVLAEESGLTIPASKRVLWTMVREIENVYVQHASEILYQQQETSETVRACIRGLVYQMGGNERWSLETKRYHELS